ncbi:MAG: sulfotransferase domain-containing protein [Nocardioidaceae bacterium]
MIRHLLVIGAQRCATTYLHSLLDAHPDITMARPARPEPKFFLAPESEARGLEWYRGAYFSHATSQSLLGEKSTSYLEDAQAARRAASVLGWAEIVVLLRDPVARAVSNWRFSTANGLEDRPLAQALTENLDRARDWDAHLTSVSPYAYVERGRYVDYLESWWARFPETVHVRFMEDLISGRAAVAELYHALDVDPGFRPAGLGQPVHAAQGPAPELEPALVARLRDYFSGSDERLRSRLGQELPWATR